MIHYVDQVIASLFNAYYFIPCEFSTAVLTDDFSLEFERQRVSSDLPDPSKYLIRFISAVVWIVLILP